MRKIKLNKKQTFFPDTLGAAGTAVTVGMRSDTWHNPLGVSFAIYLFHLADGISQGKRKKIPPPGREEKMWEYLIERYEQTKHGKKSVFPMSAGTKQLWKFLKRTCPKDLAGVQG